MGCDIHVFIEVKCVDGWKYVPLAVATDRNYDLLGLLSGVRTEGPHKRAVQGVNYDIVLPNDASEYVKKVWDDGCGGHTLTLIGIEDVRWLVKHYRRSAYVKEWLQVMEDFIKIGAEDARVILWYD